MEKDPYGNIHYILAVRKDNVRNLGFAEFKKREMEYGAKNVEKRKCVGKPTYYA